MARIKTIGSAVIWVYPNDHPPAHLHIVHPDFEALIEIETFATYAGSLKGAAGKKAMAWARANIATIKAEWNRLHPHRKVK